MPYLFCYLCRSMNIYISYFNSIFNEDFLLLFQSSMLFPGCHCRNVVNEISLESTHIFNLHVILVRVTELNQLNGFLIAHLPILPSLQNTLNKDVTV
jgi:hypothetical protein